MLVVAAILGLGWVVAVFCAYQWWQADMDATIAEERVAYLVKKAHAARQAPTPRRSDSIDHNLWGPRPYDRLVADMGLSPRPDPTPAPRLSFVDAPESDRGAIHSHAEKGRPA
jgi:hypothetical protein